MSRTIRAPHGTDLSTKGWLQEAALRMLMNNLDPDARHWHPSESIRALSLIWAPAPHRKEKPGAERRAKSRSGGMVGQ